LAQLAVGFRSIFPQPVVEHAAAAGSAASSAARRVTPTLMAAVEERLWNSRARLA